MAKLGKTTRPFLYAKFWKLHSCSLIFCKENDLLTNSAIISWPPKGVEIYAWLLPEIFINLTQFGCRIFSRKLCMLSNVKHKFNLELHPFRTWSALKWLRFSLIVGFLKEYFLKKHLIMTKTSSVFFLELAI